MNLDTMREMLIANEGLSLKVYKCTARTQSVLGVIWIVEA